MSEKLIIITKLAKDLKVSLRTLRHWEDCGLIRSTRRGHGKRQYTLEMAKQARDIQSLRYCGFSIENVQLFMGGDRYDRLDMLRAQMHANHKTVEVLTEANVRARALVETLVRERAA